MRIFFYVNCDVSLGQAKCHTVMGRNDNMENNLKMISYLLSKRDTPTEFSSNEDKNIEITVENKTYFRNAIKTHFVNIGEDYIKLIEDYVKEIYVEGDILSISEKIIALCQKRVIYKNELQLSFLAKFLSKFVNITPAGPGVGDPYKMQFAIKINGKIKIIYAAVMAGICKLFEKKGVFYKIAGQEVSGLDGFYGDIFSEYSDYGIMIPENSTGVCNEIYEKTGILSMIVDANELNVEILGCCNLIEKTEAQLCALIKDNPAGQTDQLTPFILIR